MDWVGALTYDLKPVCPDPRHVAISDLRPNPVGSTRGSEVSREIYLIICAHDSGQCWISHEKRREAHISPQDFARPLFVSVFVIFFASCTTD